MTRDKTYNILIHGGGFNNKGAEAMLKTVQQELTKRLGSATFYMYHCDPGNFELATQAGFIPFNPLRDIRKRANSLTYKPAAMLWMFKQFVKAGKFNFSAKPISFRNIARAMFMAMREKAGDIDAYIDISGFAYGDTPSWNMLSSWISQPAVDYCNANNKVAAFLPQAWGPFEKTDIALATKKLLAGDTMFFSRDEISTSYLQKLLGNKAEIKTTPDIAFKFDGSGPAEGKEILTAAGCDMRRPTIGISPNLRIMEFLDGKGENNQYVQTITQLAKYIIEQLEANVVLISNETKNITDDRYLCSLIEKQIDSTYCFAPQEKFSAEQTKSIIGNFDMLISSRFHSLIFALSQAVPVMAIGWSHKYNELMRNFCQEDLVCDMRKLTIDMCKEKTMLLWQSRNDRKAQIESHLSGIIRQIDNIFSLITKKLINGN